MIQTVNANDFVQAFETMGRKDQFTETGLRKLFDYLENLEEDTGEQIELDVIALCCDYSESSIEQVLKDYALDSIDDLRDSTTVIEVDDETVIYAAF